MGSDTFYLLKKSDLEKLERAIDVLAHSGKVPCEVEVICEALEGLLDSNDPARRAERADNHLLAEHTATIEAVEEKLIPAISSLIKKMEVGNKS